MDALPGSSLPLTEQTYFILLSLQSSPKHGYAIARDVKALSDGRVTLSVSTLYTALKRLLNNGWVRLVDTRPAQSNRPRKTYELTKVGSGVLRLEVERLASLLKTARLRGIEGAI